MRFDTKLVQHGERGAAGSGDVVRPIHLSATFERGTQDPPRYFYGRGENPTREALEDCLAALEDASHALVYSSGQAAAAAVLSLVPRGGAVVASDDVYGGTYELFAMYAQQGLRVRYVDFSDEAAVAAAVAGGVLDEADLVWVETPTNPLLKVCDLASVAALAHERGALVVVDNTLAGPAVTLPLQWADLSLYSTTKALAGHSDTLGGAIVHDDAARQEALADHRRVAGSVPGSLDCFLVRRGLKTYALRNARQVGTAAAIATFLEGHQRVAAVRYPGLASHPNHAVAGRQMASPGSLVGFEYDGDVEKLLETVRWFACAPSLGSVQSLIECPALMTHRSIPAPERRARGIADNLIRLSVGIEDPDDLLEDLADALEIA